MRNCYTCAYGGDGEELEDFGHCYRHNGESDYTQPPKENGCEEWEPKEGYIEECCETCDLRLRVEKLDCSQGGLKRSSQEGYICLAFQREGIASWIVGQDPENGVCECYMPKGKAFTVEAVTFGGERIRKIIGETRRQVDERAKREI